MLITYEWWLWSYGTIMNQAIEVPIQYVKQDTEGDGMAGIEETIAAAAAEMLGGAGVGGLKKEETKQKEGELVYGSMLVLLPLLPYINHANPTHSNAKLAYRPATKGKEAKIELVSTKEISKGDEIAITYGSYTSLPVPPPSSSSSSSDFSFAFPQVGLSNTHLLLHYGASLPLNTYERIALDFTLDDDTDELSSFPPPESEEEWEFQQQQIYEIKQLKHYILDLNNLSFHTYLSLSGILPPSFIQSIRVKHLTSTDLHYLSTLNYQFLPDKGYFSLGNEMKVRLEVIINMETLLNQYETGLKEDIDEMKKEIEKVKKDEEEREREREREGDGINNKQQQIDLVKKGGKENLVSILGYRVCLKRLIHSVILRSLNELERLFTMMSNNWERQYQERKARRETQEIKDEEDDEDADFDGAETWFQELLKWQGEMEQWRFQYENWVKDSMGNDHLIVIEDEEEQNRLLQQQE